MGTRRTKSPNKPGRSLPTVESFRDVLLAAGKPPSIEDGNKSAYAGRGRPPGPEGSLGKLAASHIARAASDAHALISGADCILAGSDAPLHGLIAEILVSVPAVSIAGGTDEIQRNIIGERVLGLPKESEVDSGRPFETSPGTSRGPSGRAFPDGGDSLCATVVRFPICSPTSV